MADPLSVATGVIGIVTFALQASIALYQTIDSFQSHPKTVRDLKEELEALSLVLQSLLETVTNDAELHLPALTLPLERCGKACNEFGEKIARCTSRSNGSRTSFRDWAKLTYMGKSITDFRTMLSGYKGTINIALANANLRKAAATPAVLDQFKIMVEEAVADLEEHHRMLEEMPHAANAQDATMSEEEEDAAELAELREQKESIRQCIEICTKASEEASAQRVNLVEDFKAGNDSCNILVSTTGELIRASRFTAGDRSFQMFGQTSDDAVQKVAQLYYMRPVLGAAGQQRD